MTTTRYAFAIIFLVAAINSFSQKAEFDVGKASVYCESYPLNYNNNGQVLQGTGFITEYLHKLYFITSYHNVVTIIFILRPHLLLKFRIKKYD